jgi:hypothetical protein
MMMMMMMMMMTMTTTTMIKPSLNFITSSILVQRPNYGMIQMKNSVLDVRYMGLANEVPAFCLFPANGSYRWI